MMARVKLESHVSHAVRARWAVPVGASGRDALVRHLVYAFLRSDPEGATDWIDSTVPTDPDELRTMLDFLLTARPPAPLPEDIAADLDTLLEAEAAERGMVDATEIPPLAITDHVPGLLGRNVAFWRGDLTRLRAGAVLNAANEQAVGAFLTGRLDWAGIVEVDAAVVAEHTARADDPPPGLDDVLAAEAWARARADEIIAAASGGPR